MIEEYEYEFMESKVRNNMPTFNDDIELN